MQNIASARTVRKMREQEKRVRVMAISCFRPLLERGLKTKEPVCARSHRGKLTRRLVLPEPQTGADIAPVEPPVSDSAQTAVAK